MPSNDAGIQETITRPFHRTKMPIENGSDNFIKPSI